MNTSVNKKSSAASRPAKRTRRTAADARSLILDAAEACMGAEGPAGLRLTQVAHQAGVSHPTLLHHFGSREALIAAVHLRAVGTMRDALTLAMRSAPAGGTDIVGLVFGAYRDGLAARLVWMFQSGFDPPPTGERTGMLAEMVGELHGLRRSLAPPGAALDEADTAAIVHLTAIAAFGDAVIGDRLRAQPTSQAEAEARQQFEHWFARVIGRCVMDGTAPTEDG